MNALTPDSFTEKGMTAFRRSLFSRNADSQNQTDNCSRNK